MFNYNLSKMSEEIEKQEEAENQEVEVSQEEQEGPQEEVAALELDGGIEVDLEHPAGEASGIKEAVAEGVEIRREERGIATAVTNPKVPEGNQEKLQVVTKIKSRHQQRTEAFFKEQERKKKLAEEKAKK